MHNPGNATPDRFPAQDRFADGAQYIAGRLTKGTSGRTHTVVDPATGEDVLTYDLAGPDDVDAAVAAARAAFPGWAGATPGERSDALHRFAAVLAERAEDFARAESLQCGKPLKLTREFDVPGTVDNAAFFAGAARHLQGQSAGSTPATTPRTSVASPSAWSGRSRRGTTRSRWPPGRSSRRSPRATPSCSSPPRSPRSPP